MGVIIHLKITSWIELIILLIVEAQSVVNFII